MNRGIAVAGNMILDYNKVIRTFPERNGLTQIESVYHSLGGAVNNVIRDLAHLDPTLPLKAYGLIGRDAEGEAILGVLRQYKNIDLTGVGFEGRTSFTDVLAELDTKLRTFLMYPGGNARFGLEHIDLDALECDLFHIGYILLLDALDAPDPEYGTQMARLLSGVKARGIKTSADVVSETGNRYQTLVPPALKYTDYFIVNEIEGGRTAGIALRDAQGALLPDRMPQALGALMRMGVGEWAIIHAPEGGFGMDARGRYVAIPSLDLPDGFIAATVGAGDAFCAGVLYAAYSGADLPEAIEDGIATAASSLSGPDASSGVLSIDGVRALAASMPRQKL